VRSCLACACRCGEAPQGDGRGWTGDASWGDVVALDSELGEVEAGHGEAMPAVVGSLGEAGKRGAGGAVAAVAMGSFRSADAQKPGSPEGSARREDVGEGVL
jgi:hypothetical protein